MAKASVATWQGRQVATGWLDAKRLAVATTISLCVWLAAIVWQLGMSLDSILVALGIGLGIPLFLLQIWRDLQLITSFGNAKRLALVMIEESGVSGAIPARVYLNRNGLEIGSDVGYIRFEGAMFVFVGERTSFRVHRSSVDTSWGIKIIGPDNSEIVLFIEPLVGGRRNAGPADDAYTAAFINWEKSEAEAVDEVLPPIVPQSTDGIGGSWLPYHAWLRLSSRVLWIGVMGIYALERDVTPWLWLVSGALVYTMALALLVKQRKAVANLGGAAILDEDGSSSRI